MFPVHVTRTKQNLGLVLNGPQIMWMELIIYKLKSARQALTFFHCQQEGV